MPVSKLVESTSATSAFPALLDDHSAVAFVVRQTIPGQILNRRRIVHRMDCNGDRIRVRQIQVVRQRGDVGGRERLGVDASVINEAGVIEPSSTRVGVTTTAPHLCR